MSAILYGTPCSALKLVATVTLRGGVVPSEIDLLSTGSKAERPIVILEREDQKESERARAWRK